MTKQQERILDNVENSFLPQLKEVFGANLLSVTLYGSAITERFVDGISDVNVLIVLDRVDPKSVTTLGKAASRNMKKNRITPLILTDEEYLGSADVFPMEYLDIVDSRKVLFGEDLTGKLEISKQNLRHQLEEELRGSINGLRKALIGTKGNSRLMQRIMRSWLGSQNAMFRGMLRLGDVNDIPAGADTTIDALSKRYQVDTSALKDAARLRSGEKIDAVAAAQGLLVCLTELVAKIDSMDS